MALVIGTPLVHAQTSEAVPPGSAAVGNEPELRAQLTPRNYTTLSSELAGRIDRIAPHVGDHFKKGDVLVQFDCGIEKAQVAHAGAVLAAAEKTFAINQRLAQLKSVGQLELELSQAEIGKAKADVAGAAAAAAKCTIIAPFSGVAVEQKAREFQYATPGQPLLDIVDDSSLEVELIVPSKWLGWLKPGYRFQVQVEETGKSYTAQLTHLNGQVDPVSQSIKIYGELPGGNIGLMSGMSGKAEISPPTK
jgi:membrane fusion protein (multidrug efflux system)